MRTLSRNTLTLLVSNGGSALLSFGLSVLIGRVMGKEGLGVYATVLAWVFPLSLVAEFGLGTLITREAARNPAVERNYLWLATQVRWWLGGGLTILLMIGAPLLSNDRLVVSGLQISAPLILINPLFGNFTAIFRARQQMWPIPWLNVGMLVVQVTLTAGVFLLGGDVLVALVVNTLTSAGQLGAAWWVWRRFFTSPPSPLSTSGEIVHIQNPGQSDYSTPSSPALLPRVQGRREQTHLTHTGIVAGQKNSPSNPIAPYELEKILPFLRRAWPFAVAAVLAAVQMRLATIMLEKMTDAGSVGYYAAAARFVEAGRTIPNALFGALFPVLAAITAQPHQMKSAFCKVMLGLAGFGGLLGVLFSLLSPIILRATYGDDFGRAEATLQVAMWGLLPALLRAGLTLYWYAVGRERLVNWVTLLMIIVQGGLSLFLIPAEGAAGAAVAVLVSEALGLFMLSIPIWRRGFSGGVSVRA